MNSCEENALSSTYHQRTRILVPVTLGFTTHTHTHTHTHTERERERERERKFISVTLIHNTHATAHVVANGSIHITSLVPRTGQAPKTVSSNSPKWASSFSYKRTPGPHANNQLLWQTTITIANPDALANSLPSLFFLCVCVCYYLFIL